MPDLLTNPIFLTSCFLFLLAAYYLFTLYSDIKTKDEQILQQQNAYNNMLRSFNELDEQAKLIVKTDLELNKAQEELDKRLNGLNALQRTSRQISQSMNEQQVFEKLTSNTFEDLGYSKVIIVINDDHQNPKARIYFGFEENKLPYLIDTIIKDNTLKTALDEGRTLSSMNASRKTKEKMQQIFDAEHCILAPIVTQTGTLGFILVGNHQTTVNISQADEELISILAGQIGQAIENTQLFDNVFRSSQELEIKVKERTKQLASILAQVEEINKKKTEFISAVSHELRTPLTSIKGYAAILLTGKIGEVPPAVKERLAKINLHSDNLVNLINNLLDIARIESGRIDMNFLPYKIERIFDDISDLLTPQLSSKDIKLKAILSENINEVYVDFSHAERVFINLLSNAVKFSPKGGTITLSVLPTLENGFATFHVTDTGIGIAPADLEKLFTEFFRVENEINQSVKGTGLGLVLAKEIVSAHHGRMWVTSQVGVGTTFCFTLPTNQEAYEKAKKSPLLVQEG
jgi:signal transduction histidine kinase